MQTIVTTRYIFQMELVIVNLSTSGGIYEYDDARLRFPHERNFEFVGHLFKTHQYLSDNFDCDGIITHLKDTFSI